MSNFCEGCRYCLEDGTCASYPWCCYEEQRFLDLLFPDEYVEDDG